MWFFDGRETGKGFARFERLAMFGGEAMFVDGGDVSFGAVTDMFVEAVVWVFFGEVHHVVVTSDFGDDGSGGNGFEFAVGFDASGDVWGERSALKKIDFTVDDNLGKGDVFGLDCFDGTTGAEFESFADTDLVEF